MSSMLAMPCTTVQKMIGAITIRMAAMKASPNGFMLRADARVEVAEQGADHDRDQHLHVKVTPEWPVHRRVGGCRVDCHPILP